MDNTRPMKQLPHILCVWKHSKVTERDHLTWGDIALLRNCNVNSRDRMYCFYFQTILFPICCEHMVESQRICQGAFNGNAIEIDKGTWKAAVGSERVSEKPPVTEGPGKTSSTWKD